MLKHDCNRKISCSNLLTNTLFTVRLACPCAGSTLERAAPHLQFGEKGSHWVAYSGVAGAAQRAYLFY